MFNCLSCSEMFDKLVCITRFENFDDFNMKITVQVNNDLKDGFKLINAIAICFVFF